MATVLPSSDGGCGHHVHRYYGLTIKHPISQSLNPNRRILTWTPSDYQNFLHPLLRRYCQPARLHVVAVVGSTTSPLSARPSSARSGTTLSHSSSTIAIVVPLLLRRHHPTPPSPPRRSASHTPSALRSEPSRLLPDRLHHHRRCAWELCCLPVHHRLRFHTARL
jgi:hypothetical protein